jgi:serine/threonine protein kinase
MPAPATIDDFLDVVRKSNQVDTARLDEHLRKLSQKDAMPAEPRKLAAVLVRDGVITGFQAEQFLQGKWRGFTIGGYRILERIGAGGSGTVYLAEHQVMKRRVAVKMLPPHLNDGPAAVERFRREAQAIAALDHPNIVRAHDFRQEGPIHFLVMEYINGPSLQEVVQRQGALPVAVACEYIRQAAIGLEHAHKAGLVHRDVKPGNLLVDASGTVKVLDLGLARYAPEGQESVTKKFDENTVMGTADYLAPEQALSLHNVDARADIYSLGATFYTLLAGEPPFHEGSVTQKLLWHQMRSPVPLRKRRPEVPEEVDEIISAMMAKDPNERLQTAAEVAALLEPWSTGGPAPQGPGTAVRPGPPSPRPSSYVKASAIGKGSSRKLSAQAVKVRAAAPRERQGGPDEPEERDRSPALGPDDSATRVLGVAMLAAVMGGIVLLVVGVIAFLVWGPQPNAPARSQQGPADEPMARPAVVPDTGVLWRSGPPGQLANIIGEVLRLDEGPLGSDRVAFARDGRHVATAGFDRNLRIWDVLTGEKQAVLGGHGGRVTYVVYSRSGGRVLSASADKTARLWDTGTRREVKRYGGHQKLVWCAVFTADEKQVLTCGDDAVVRLFAADTGKVVKEMKGHQGAVKSVSCRPVGKREALSAGTDKTIRVWNLDSGKEEGQLKGHTAGVNAVSYVPDGSKAVSVGNDGSVCYWDVDNRQRLHEWKGHTQAVWMVAVSAEGRRALSCDAGGKIMLWDLATKESLNVYMGHDRGVTGVAFAPDGRHFASTSQDATLRLWGLPPPR